MHDEPWQSVIAQRTKRAAIPQDATTPAQAHAIRLAPHDVRAGLALWAANPPPRQELASMLRNLLRCP